jgi:hypothetical protein
MDRVIGLPRSTYESLIAFLEIYYDSLNAVSQNLDLAYSMLVFGLESLTQTFHKPVPLWEDYDEGVRRELDEHFSKVDTETVSKIKTSLLKNSHLKLKKRFLEFICSNIEDSYFTDEAQSSLQPLRKSELRRTLSHIYDLRSGYVHQLNTIQHQLKVPFIGELDVFRWNNEPYLTYRGMIRLVRHVLNSRVYM